VQLLVVGCEVGVGDSRNIVGIDGFAPCLELLDRFGRVVLSVGMLGLEMLGALPVPWTGGISMVVGLLIVYGEDDSCVVKRDRESRTRRVVYSKAQYPQCKQPYGADTYIHLVPGSLTQALPINALDRGLRGLPGFSNAR
jgi:hypothetical protein